MKRVNISTTSALCATILCATTGLQASAQTTSIQYWSNHGAAPTISVAPNSAQACALINVASGGTAITDTDPDNFAQFLSLLSADCETSIRTSVLASPGTTDVPASPGVPRYAGYFLGGDFAGVSALSDVTLRTYDDGVLAETATSGAGITLIDLGDANFFVYFQVEAPFDDVEIEFGSLVAALEDLEVYYAFATTGTGTFGPVSNVPLPLDGTILRAKSFEKGVQLSWNAPPVSCTQVVVERSVDGASDATEIVALPSSVLTFFDAKATPGKWHTYRLRIGRADGSYTYTAATTVFVAATADAAWQVYPNPATDALNIRISQAGEHRVTLRNASGMVVFQQSYASDGAGTLTLPRQAVQTAAGLYMLELNTPSGETLHQRVVFR